MVKGITTIMLSAVLTSSVLGNTTNAIKPTDIKAETQQTVVQEEMWLKPTQGSWIKPYEDYRLITDTSSPQYKFLNCRKDVTTNSKGFLMQNNEWYCVALGSYFGEVGTKYILTLDTGKKLKVVKGEAKADCDTDSDNYLAQSGHIIEILINPDYGYMQSNIGNNGLIFNGNFNSVFEGNIVKIEKVKGGDNFEEAKTD